MRVGFIVHKDVPNFNYRAIGPADALRQAGHGVEMSYVERRDLRVDMERLRRCDVVHVYRLTNKETIAYIDALHSQGIAITWDNDDDIRLLPGNVRKYTKIPVLQAEQDFRNQAKLFRRVDVVTTTTDTLAERWQAVGAGTVMVVPNYPHADQFAAPAPHDGLVIGWVAALEHQVDAEALGLADTLRRVLERHAKARVATIGVRLELDHERYEHVAYVPFPELKEHIRRFDIGIAPISDLRWNHARSDIKIKEYAAAGVPWLASDRGSYARYGRAQGGWLVADDRWEAALQALLGSRLKRATLRRRAGAWGKTQSVDRHVDEWVAVFERARAIASERGASSRTPAGAGRGQ